MTGTGLPHSEIPGSKRACRSPRLIAACRVLHRLLSPRHPSCALTSLTTKNPVRIRCRDTCGGIGSPVSRVRCTSLGRRRCSELLRNRLRGRSFSRSYACAVVKEPSFRVFRARRSRRMAGLQTRQVPLPPFCPVPYALSVVRPSGGRVTCRAL